MQKHPCNTDLALDVFTRSHADVFDIVKKWERMSSVAVKDNAQMRAIFRKIAATPNASCGHETALNSFSPK